MSVFNLMKLFRKDSEKIKIPASVQDIIPAQEAYSDGIFRSGRRYSKSFSFEDINYLILSDEDRESIFLEYSRTLNSFDSEAYSEITLYRRKVPKEYIAGRCLFSMKGDGLDELRNEYNSVISEISTGMSSYTTDRILTVSAEKDSVAEARSYFSRIYAGLSQRFSSLGSKLSPLDLSGRLKLLSGFMRNEEHIRPDIKAPLPLSEDFRDIISPDGVKREPDCLKLGNRYVRTMFLRDYASYIRDSFIPDMMNSECTMMISFTIEPVRTEEAVKKIESKLLGVETNITNWQRRQNTSGNYNAIIPPDLEQQREESKAFLEDLTSRDQRMMLTSVTMAVTAGSKEKLDDLTDTLCTKAEEHMCRFSLLRYQQTEGLNTVLPYALRKVKTVRTLTTESLAVLMPFDAKEINDPGGIYYAQNALSGNMIIADRKNLLNGNSMVLGVSGSGKSFMSKSEIISLILKGGSDVIIIDPESEYAPLINSLNGEVVKLSAESDSHINALDINSEYADGKNPVSLKSEFLLSLFELLGDDGSLGPRQRSIIDRCASIVYREYAGRGYTGEAPTLSDLRRELLNQPEEEASKLALELEIFTDGSFNTFSMYTNVSMDSELICFDIKDLGRQLMQIGMLVVLDSILNRITKNRASGKSTFIFIDEIYILLSHEYSANFLFTLWKRVRKYGAFCTGITQNAEDLLQNHTVRAMLANSEFLIMMNQAPSDSKELSDLLGISESQESYMTNVPYGCGIMKIGSSLIPFSSSFPKDTKLYALMTTKPGEADLQDESEKYDCRKN